MAEAVKTESGKWLARAHVNGKCRRFTRRLKKDAEKAAETWEGEEEERAKREEESKENPTLKEAGDAYLESHANILSVSTIRGYVVIQHAIKPIENIRSRDLTKENLQNFLNDYSANRAPKTVRNASAFISKIIKSVDEKIVIKPDLPPKRKVIYDIPEESKIEQMVAMTQGTELQKAILLSAFASLRRSEIAALTPEDFSDNTVTITKALLKDRYNNYVIQDRAKSEEGIRVILIPPEVATICKSGVDMNPQAITDGFIKIRDALGMKSRFHDLRHYSASMLHALGVPNKYIMERGGWKSETTLERVYQHTFSQKTREVGDIVNEQFQKAVSLAVSVNK